MGRRCQMCCTSTATRAPRRPWRGQPTLQSRSEGECSWPYSAVHPYRALFAVTTLLVLQHGSADIDMGACRYVEVHMEQGPVLESRGYAIGPVAAIAGQTRLAVSVEGTQASSVTFLLVSREPPRLGRRCACLFGHARHQALLPL